MYFPHLVDGGKKTKLVKVFIEAGQQRNQACDIRGLNEGHGIMDIKWEDGFVIKTKYENGEVMIYANKEGLISLANIFNALAEDKVDAGTHIHLDQYNSLED